MHGLHIADFRRTDDAVNLQIAVGCRRWPDAPRFVRQLQIVRAAVGFAENGNRFDSKFAARANDSKGDFAAVRNQNSLKHGITVEKPENVNRLNLKR
jgi:hypothetical protein